MSVLRTSMTNGRVLAYQGDPPRLLEQLEERVDNREIQCRDSESTGMWAMFESRRAKVLLSSHRL
jgi:hypothetical protein